VLLAILVRLAQLASKVLQALQELLASVVLLVFKVPLARQE
jgi:hypothetical protein